MLIESGRRMPGRMKSRTAVWGGLLLILGGAMLSASAAYNGPDRVLRGTGKKSAIGQATVVWGTARLLQETMTLT